MPKGSHTPIVDPFRPRIVPYRSAAFRSAIDQALDQARSSDTLLIFGEWGTGKTNLARLIHRAGPRREKRYFEWPATAGPLWPPAFDAYGWVKGAGPDLPPRKGVFDRCHGGTVMVDHLHDCAYEEQEVFLEYLEDGRVRRRGALRWRKTDVRLILITDGDPPWPVRRGAIMPGLFERLKGNMLRVPPLRERPEDIGPLFLDHLGRMANKCGAACPRVTQEALEYLTRRKLRWNGWDLESLAARAVTRRWTGDLDQEAIVLLSRSGGRRVD